jgi:two-component sensor histidine kinase
MQNIPHIEQIHLILHEILTNTYEHAILKIENKEERKKEKKFYKNLTKIENFSLKLN